MSKKAHNIQTLKEVYVIIKERAYNKKGVQNDRTNKSF